MMASVAVSIARRLASAGELSSGSSGSPATISASGGAVKEVNYAIRFHIHPSVALTRIWEDRGVLLRTPEGVVL